MLLKALLLYILLQELHEGGLGLVKSLDHQTLGLVHLKETKGLVSSRLVHLYFFNLSLALGSAVPIARVKWKCLNLRGTNYQMDHIWCASSRLRKSAGL